jgi:hypothetical protein
MKRDKRVGLERILVTAIGLVVMGGTAQAQMTPGAVNRPAPVGPDAGTYTPQAIGNYDAKGVAVGSFRLFPDIEFNEVYNDNIYATPTGQAATGAFVQLIKPTLDLRSDWSNHMLNMFARGNFGFYSVDSVSNNYQDLSAGFDGRIDIQRGWNTYGGFSFSRKHEDRGGPNTVTSGFSPTVFNQISGNVGYYQEFNRLNVRLDARVDNYNYFDNGLNPSSGVIQNDDRDRTEWREAARFGYEFSPGYQVWVRGSLNQRRYDRVPDDTGFDRNSTGWDAVGGVTVDLGGITSFEAFVGYLQQNYEDPRLQSIQTPQFGLTGYWNPIRELMVKPFVRRTIEDTALTTAVSYISTGVGTDVTYSLRPNIQIDAHGDYSIADYGFFPGVTQQRYDQYLTLRASVLYRPTPNFYIGPSYQYLYRDSNQTAQSYGQNVVMLRLGARL